mgnify:CR=1 FL=1|jgi:hypothetical protein
MSFNTTLRYVSEIFPANMVQLILIKFDLKVKCCKKKLSYEEKLDVSI